MNAVVCGLNFIIYSPDGQVAKRIKTINFMCNRIQCYLKHKRAVFVTARLCIGRDDLAPTQPVSFLSLLRQLHGLRKNRSWRKLCVADAWNRNLSRRLSCEEPGHHEHGAYRGDSLSVCVLDVGAFDF